MGISDTPLAHRQKAIGLDRMPLANGGRTVGVFLTGTPFRSGHLEDDREELIGVRQALGIRSAIATPLYVNSELRGVLEVTSQAPEQYSAEDLRFLEAVARWVGSVLHRAELVERITEDAVESTRRATADELITILAHDLRAPLTPVAGYIGMIRHLGEQQNRPDLVQYTRAAERGIGRMQRLLSDLLDTARLEHRLFAPTLEPVNLAALVRETTDVLQSPSVPIVVHAPEQLVVEVDADRIRQTLENLVSNALRHSPAGVPVAIDLSTEPEGEAMCAVITVLDTGPGIAPEFLPHLFTRQNFGRSKHGLGLGLYLAHGIARAHNGSLSVESTLGKGASFRLALPLPSGV